MADMRRYALTPQLDINQIIMEAKERWLRPAEICEILKNYRNFRIETEPPNQPLSGSLFLFDRKVLRYFRKDGHNWRKKKDGKTVKEAHERLKSGSVDVLHCYYAHGEDNVNFQRRSYWMLEEDFMHIVLVHYLETKGGRSSGRSKGVEENSGDVQMDSPGCSVSLTNYSQLPSQNTDGESQLSGHNSEYEDAESDFNSTRSGHYPIPEMHKYGVGPLMDPSLSSAHGSHSLASYNGNFQSLETNTSNYDAYFDVESTISGMSKPGFVPNADFGNYQFSFPPTEFGGTAFDPFASSGQFSYTENDPMDPFTYPALHTNDDEFKETNFTSSSAVPDTLWQFDSAAGEFASDDLVAADGSIMESNNNTYILRNQGVAPADDNDGLQKLDSFSRWMNREFGGITNSDMNSLSGPHWNPIEPDRLIEDSNREQVDPYTVNPMLSQDQLYSIADISPSWTYAGQETKVLISGRFLENTKEMLRHKWSCMFGEVEVPVEILSTETLECYAPPHEAARVPFYITCFNRSACSEVREFEFRSSDSLLVERPDVYGLGNEMHSLRMRLDKLLALDGADTEADACNSSEKNNDFSEKIACLMREDDEWSNLLKLFDENDHPLDTTNDRSLETLLKGKLQRWLTHKVREGCKGPNVRDENGQGVLHLAAALGYDWAIRPTVIAGGNVNFTDVHGWTALHWAAYYGRERAVVSLVALGANCGALTDPTPEFPSGRPPADLASEHEHKGIAGFLAESSLTNHLKILTLKDKKDLDVETFHDALGIEDFSEHDSWMLHPSGDLHVESMRDSLAAVRKATQAAARIYQVYRLQSFQRKQATEYHNDPDGMPDVRSIQMATANPGQHDMPLHLAATRIQNKFRGWKGRKEYLRMRQSVVKIQAHFRGHQVRKQYKKIIWSVMIMEKVILRWRRRRPGLRRYQPEGSIEGSSSQSQQPVEDEDEDEYEFLNKGRKETEERLVKALNRVKSMVQYPHAREQYRKLLTVVTQLKESQAAAVQDRSMLAENDDVDDSDFMMVKEYLEVDTQMLGV